MEGAGFPVNVASLRMGAYVKISGKCGTFKYRDYMLNDEIHRNDLSHDSNQDLQNEFACQGCPAYAPKENTITVHLLRPFLIDTIVMRLYYVDGRSYVFDEFDTTEDGRTWKPVLSPGTQREGSFTETFPVRKVKAIRLSGESAGSKHTHKAPLCIVRFQAFYAFPEILPGPFF